MSDDIWERAERLPPAERQAFMSWAMQEITRRRVMKELPTAGALAAEFDPKNNQTADLAMIDEALEWAFNTPDARLMISKPSQTGKSERVAVWGMVRALIRNPDCRIIIATHSEDLALTHSERIRSILAAHGTGARDSQTGVLLPDRLGIGLGAKNAASRWTLAGHIGGVVAVGVGTALPGKPADLLLLDDLYAGMEQADSPAYRRRVNLWWDTVASQRPGPGAPVIAIGCLGGDMRVLHGEGRWVPIKDMRAGDTVVALDQPTGQLITALVTGQRRSGADETFTVRTARLALTVNARHPFAVLRRNALRPSYADLQWIHAGELTIGDIVVTAKCLPDDHKPVDQLPDGCEVSTELAWLLGYMLGDGWVTASKHKGGNSFSVCVATGSSDRPEKVDLTERVTAALASWSTSRVYDSGYGYLRTDWTAGGALLADMGYSAGAKHKRIPDVVWGWSIELRREFLRGYMMADGTLQYSGNTNSKRRSAETWRAEAANHDLIEDIGYLALTCGARPTTIFSRKRQIQPPNSPAPVWMESHSIAVAFTEDHAEGRAILSPWGGGHPAPRHLRFERITAIDPSIYQDVYDLEVEGAGNFVGEGFVVHNTRWNEYDAHAYLMEKNPGKWRVLNFPAIAENGLDDALSREPGVFLENPRGYTDWEAIRETKPARVWASMYQGDPGPSDGALFSASWFDDHRVDTAPPLYRRIVGIDPAETGTGDEAGIIAGGLDETGRVVLTDDASGHLSSAQWPRTACLLALRTAASEVYFEAYSAPKTYEGLLQRAYDDLVAEAVKLTAELPEAERAAMPAGIAGVVEGVSVPFVRPFAIYPWKGHGNAVVRSTGFRHGTSSGKCRVVGHRLATMERQAVRWFEGQHSPDRVSAGTVVFDVLAPSTPAVVTGGAEGWGSMPSGLA